MEPLSPATVSRPAPCLACGRTPCTVPVRTAEGGPITGALCERCARRLVVLRALAAQAQRPCAGRRRPMAVIRPAERRSACR